MIIDAPLVILMSIVFVAVFLFVRTIDKRKWLTLLVSFVLTPLVYFYMCYPMINIFSNYHHKKYFSQEIWNEQPNLRYEISDDLIRSKYLIGKSKTEVTNILGAYEWLTWNDSLNSKDPNLWNYSLGIEPGAFNSAKECMELVFKNESAIAVNTFKETVKFDDKD